MKLPADHPQRIELNDEVHARPPEPLVAPSRLSYLALLCDAAQREAGWPAVCDLCRRYGVEPPAQSVSHFTADLGPFRLKWERHTEFIRFMFIVEGTTGDPFERPAIAVLPEDWVAALPGQVIVAAHAALIRAGAAGRSIRDSDRPKLVRRQCADRRGGLRRGRDGADGFPHPCRRVQPASAAGSRHHALAGRPRRAASAGDRHLPHHGAARAAGRPRRGAAADRVGARAGEDHRCLDGHRRRTDEPALLNSLTRLEAEIENRQSQTRYRFSAADAYYELVQRRIDELREQRIQGLQTFREFTERRLAPAMNTCRSVAARQESLSQRVARATRLLATRVDLTRGAAEPGVAGIDEHRRARLQLRLQSTVEGLSVAAVTYYVVRAGRAMRPRRWARPGVPVEPDLAMGISIPVVAVVAWFGIHHIRRAVTRPRGEQSER